MAKRLSSSDAPRLFILGTVIFLGAVKFGWNQKAKLGKYEYTGIDGVDYKHMGEGEHAFTLEGRILEYENTADTNTQLGQIVDLLKRNRDPIDFAFPNIGGFPVLVEELDIGEVAEQEGLTFSLKAYKVTAIVEKIIKKAESDAKIDAKVSDQKLTTYVIQSGDTLWEISERFYGDGRSWPKLWELNKQRFSAHSPSSKDPNLIYPNTEILV